MTTISTALDAVQAALDWLDLDAARSHTSPTGGAFPRPQGFMYLSATRPENIRLILDALREAQRDAERLSWCEKQWQNGLHLEVCAQNVGLTVHGLQPTATVYVGLTVAKGDNLRTAIDAAMQEKP